MRVESGSQGTRGVPANVAGREDRVTSRGCTVPSWTTVYKRRMQARKLRGVGVVKSELLLNNACRMKLAEKPPSDRRLIEIYNNVHRARVEVGPREVKRCRVCAAVSSKFCYCGFDIVSCVNIAHLEEFFTFVKSPRNPILPFFRF